MPLARISMALSPPSLSLSLFLPLSLSLSLSLPLSIRLYRPLDYILRSYKAVLDKFTVKSEKETKR